MSDRFAKKWGESKEYSPSLSTKVKETVKPQGPLKPRLDFAVRRIEGQVQRLDQAGSRFSERDKHLFSRIIESYSKHDIPHANVFANELAEMRKMERMIMHAKLALEQIVLRLKTVSDLGDVVSTLGPAVSVLQGVRSGMSGILPEAESELGQIGTMLSGIIVDSGQSSDLTINLGAANEDAQKILAEAATVAEEKIKDTLPELPAGLPSASQKAQVQI